MTYAIAILVLELGQTRKQREKAFLTNTEETKETLEILNNRIGELEKGIQVLRDYKA